MAKAKLGDIDVEFFLTAPGFDKVTSTIPCAPWMMKVIEDPPADGRASKSHVPALLQTKAETHVVQFHVPMLGHARRLACNCMRLSCDEAKQWIHRLSN